MIVLLAIVLSSPLAFYAMDQWLHQFAYRIDISRWGCLLAGFISIAVALMTVSFQIIKAALANPIQSLKVE